MKKITENELIVALRQNSNKSKLNFKKQLLKKIKKEVKSGKTNLFLNFFVNKKRFYVPFTILLLILTITPFAINFYNSNQSNSAFINSSNGNFDSKPEIESKSSSDDFFYERSNTATKNGSPSYQIEQQGNLNGREVDDNAFYNDYVQYKKKTGYFRLYELDKERFKITLTDKNGKRVFGKKIIIKGNAAISPETITTLADGSVYYFPYARFKYSASQPVIGINSNYQITIGNNTFMRSAQEKEWNFQLNSVETFSKTDLEIAFTLDTTGSMTDQINQLKSTIKSVSDQANQFGNISKIRWGLVLYRDKDDEYITRKYDFTDDINQFQRNLNEAQSGGGGDYPENANKALEETIENLSWRENSVKMSFLVTDAPPHMDYNQNYDYADAAINANKKGIKIFTIASSGLDNSEGEYIYRQLSLVSNAKYLFITNANGDTQYHVDDNNLDVKKLDKLVVDILRDEVEKLGK